MFLGDRESLLGRSTMPSRVDFAFVLRNQRGFSSMSWNVFGFFNLFACVFFFLLRTIENRKKKHGFFHLGLRLFLVEGCLDFLTTERERFSGFLFLLLLFFLKMNLSILKKRKRKVLETFKNDYYFLNPKGFCVFKNINI